MNLIDIITYYKKTNEFDIVYSEFKKQIRFLIKSFNIELYENDIFLFLWNIIEKIEVDNFNHEKALYTYIYKALKNQCLNIYKKQCKDKVIIYDSSITNNIIDGQSFYNLNDNYNIIFNNLISCLSKNQKKIINLRYKFGLSDIEIADILLISRQAVYKNRKLALSKLQNSINYI